MEIVLEMQLLCQKNVCILALYPPNNNNNTTPPLTNFNWTPLSPPPLLLLPHPCWLGPTTFSSLPSPPSFWALVWLGLTVFFFLFFLGLPADRHPRGLRGRCGLPAQVRGAEPPAGDTILMGGDRPGRKRVATGAGFSWLTRIHLPPLGDSQLHLRRHSTHLGWWAAVSIIFSSSCFPTVLGFHHA